MGVTPAQDVKAEQAEERVCPGRQAVQNVGAWMGQEGSWQQSAGYKNQQCEEEFCTRLPLGVGLNPSRVKESFRTGSSLVGDSETQLIYGGHFCKGHPPPHARGCQSPNGCRKCPGNAAARFRVSESEWWPCQNSCMMKESVLRGKAAMVVRKGLHTKGLTNAVNREKGRYIFHHQIRKLQRRKWENSSHKSSRHLDTTWFIFQVSNSSHFAVYRRPSWGRGENQGKQKIKVDWNGGHPDCTHSTLI